MTEQQNNEGHWQVAPVTAVQYLVQDGGGEDQRKGKIDQGRGHGTEGL